MATSRFFETDKPQHVQMYNLLPLDEVLCSPLVFVSQGQLQDMLETRALQECEDWLQLFSQRWNARHLRLLREHVSN